MAELILDERARVCKTCNKTFEAYPASKRYCSDECKSKLRNGRKKKPKRWTCENCGKEFWRPKATKDACRCCSRECGFELLDREKRERGRKQREETERARSSSGIVEWIRRWKRCRECKLLFWDYGYSGLCSDDCKKEAYKRAAREKYEPNIQPVVLVKMTCDYCSDWFFVEQWRKVKRYCSMACGKAMQRRRRKARKKEQFVEDVGIGYLIERDNGKCQICKQKVLTNKKAPHPRSPTMDHIVPLAKGGKHERKNLQLACFLCNSIKGCSTNGIQLRLF